MKVFTEKLIFKICGIITLSLPFYFLFRAIQFFLKWINKDPELRSLHSGTVFEFLDLFFSCFFFAGTLIYFLFSWFILRIYYLTEKSYFTYILSFIGSAGIFVNTGLYILKVNERDLFYFNKIDDIFIGVGLLMLFTCTPIASILSLTGLYRHYLKNHHSPL